VSIEKYKQNTIETTKNGLGLGKNTNLLTLSRIKNKTIMAVFDLSKYKLCLIDNVREINAKKIIK
jgi:hypothetical protein|tara:strand:- start:733 stop:927 length:195 start_codon:yes stop_codon:yes gene_type:complete